MPGSKKQKLSAWSKIKPRLLKNEQASISLEAAVVLPGFLIFMAIVFLFSLSIRMDVVYQESAYSAIREAELILTVWGDTENLKALAPENIDLLDFSPEDIEELAADLLKLGSLDLFLQKRQEYYLKQNLTTELINMFFQDRAATVYLAEDGLLYYEFNYTCPNFLGARQYMYKLPIPYWGGSDVNLLDNVSKESKQDTEQDIWSEPEFSRGKFFQQEFGANLPFNYPVLSSYKDGVATSIKSIDLTAQSYQNEDNLLRKVNSAAQKLLNFSGTKDWGKDKITIAAQDIHTRVLLIVVPGNSEADLLDELRDLQTDWAAKGVTLEIRKYGISEKYN